MHGNGIVVKKRERDLLVFFFLCKESLGIFVPEYRKNNANPTEIRALVMCYANK